MSNKLPYESYLSVKAFYEFFEEHPELFQNKHGGLTLTEYLNYFENRSEKAGSFFKANIYYKQELLVKYKDKVVFYEHRPIETGRQLLTNIIFQLSPSFHFNACIIPFVTDIEKGEIKILADLQFYSFEGNQALNFIQENVEFEDFSAFKTSNNSSGFPIVAQANPFQQ